MSRILKTSLHKGDRMIDIKIRITDKSYNIAVIAHAVELKYPVDETKANYLVDADFLLVREHQAMSWTEENVFNTYLSYDEMTDVEFLNYQGKNNVKY